MDQKIEDRGLIRRYLLGELTEDERQQFEKRMMTDNELFNEALLAEDEMVEDYVQDRLPGRERAQFEASFLSTDDGREQVNFARALSRYVSTSAASQAAEVRKKGFQSVWWRRSFFGPYVRIAAAAVVVLGIGLGIWRVFFYQSEVSKGTAALAYAYRDQRPFEARISGLGYAPAAMTRGDEEKVDRVARNRAERILLDEVSEHPSPVAHHALGKLYLAEQKFEDAIAQFEEALKADANNAQLHSDYGVTLFEKGKADLGQSSPRFGDLAKAFEHFDLALELDRSLLEALFNRALVLESLTLTARAAEAWKAYLDRDSRSKWADEAREHLTELEQRNTKRISQDSDQIYREFLSGYESGDDDRAWRALSSSRNSQGSSIQNKAADDWVESASRGPMDVHADLGALRYAANLESVRAGDLYSSDVLAFYEKANPKQRDELNLARSLMRNAYGHFVQSNCAEAINLYSKAGRVFDQIGDRGEAAFTRYRLGHCYIRQADRDKARQVFERLHAECESRRYRWLLAQSEHQLADIKMGLTEYSNAVEHSNRALELFEAYDTYGVIAVLVQLADEHRRLNEIGQSFDYLRRGMRLTAEGLPDLVPAWGCCIVAALNLNLMGHHRAALEYQTEALELALAMNRPLLVSRSYEYTGVTNGKLGRYGEALDRLQRAFDIGEAISGELAGTEMMAHSSLLLGDTYQQAGDPRQALKAYDQSVELYQKLGFEFYNYDANKGRLRCYVALGDIASAENEIETVMALLEEHRSKISAERYRNSFFDIEQGIVDAVIDFKYTHDQAGKAYEYSELCRARSLLSLMKTENAASGVVRGASTTNHAPATRQENVGEAHLALTASSMSRLTSRPLGLLDVQMQMPEEAQLLQYSVLNNKIVAWLVTKHALQSAVANIESDELKNEIEQYLSAIKNASEAQNAQAMELAGRLYEILIQPIEPWLDKSREIAIVPDKMLNRLPFQALVNPASGKYLLEDYRISYSPSSTAFIINSAIAKRRAITAEEQLLAVGGPRFDRSLAKKFEDLPSARKEAEQSALYYRDRWVLIGESARERQVKSLIEKSDVVLIATHYSSSAGSSDDSRLLLAEEPKQSAKAEAADGVLTAAEVLKLDLKRPRLVVLSACGTGVEQVFAGEGAISMARSFIAKGAPLVVASLWGVNSDATADLMIRFHRYRKVDHLSTASALRRAQLDAVRGADSRYRRPYYWAAFVTIGGYAEF